MRRIGPRDVSVLREPSIRRSTIMITSRNNIIFKHIWGISAFIPLALLSACAQAAAPALTPAPLPNNAQLVERLETAKRLDWTNALDSNVAPTEQEDFLSQMNKADRAIKELTHGFSVPQSEIEDALWVPPKSISAKQKTQLIEQLQNAIEQDDRNEQEQLTDANWNDSIPLETS